MTLSMKSTPTVRNVGWHRSCMTRNSPKPHSQRPRPGRATCGLGICRVTSLACHLGHMLTVLAVVRWRTAGDGAHVAQTTTIVMLVLPGCVDLMANGTCTCSFATARQWRIPQNSNQRWHAPNQRAKSCQWARALVVAVVVVLALVRSNSHQGCLAGGGGSTHAIHQDECSHTLCWHIAAGDSWGMAAIQNQPSSLP